jgi:hypothetical protein
LKINKNLDSSGTSFFGTTLLASAKQIQSVMGSSLWSCPKSNFNWHALTEKEEVFTVYDWKEGEISKDEMVCFHIGGFNKESTDRAKQELIRLMPRGMLVS